MLISTLSVWIGRLGTGAHGERVGRSEQYAAQGVYCSWEVLAGTRVCAPLYSTLLPRGGIRGSAATPTSATSVEFVTKTWYRWCRPADVPVPEYHERCVNR